MKHAYVIIFVTITRFLAVYNKIYIILATLLNMRNDKFCNYYAVRKTCA